LERSGRRFVIGARSLLLSLALSVGMASPAWAQEAGSGAGADDPLGGPSEHGVRFTPGMATAIGRTFVREVLIDRYEMDESKAEQATEILARRFMEFAHQHEDAGQELLENLIVQGLEMDTTNRRDGFQGMSLGLARELAARMPALMPAIREAMNGAAGDVRPLLPLKGQLRLTGELALANLAADAFEKNLARWSKGEVQPFADPFVESQPRAKKAEDGETRVLKDAREAAERSSHLPVKWMESYLEDGKKYYQLDPSQSAAGESLVREYVERIRAAVGGEEEWRREVSGDRFWMTIAMEMPGNWNNPLSARLWERFWNKLMLARELHFEFAARVEEIATQAQREAAEKRVQAALKEKGYEWEAFTEVTATAPASGGE
jgi:hypothetical protein